MSSGADLFVVCKQCGSQVSPYITECPYCGHRLRRRAPKLPREGDAAGRRARIPASLGRVRAGEIPGLRADAPPYATAALVLITGAMWIAWRGDYVALHDLLIDGPLRGHPGRLLFSQFTYVSGLYQFVALLAVGVFGWLLERRHGPLLVVAVFLGGGITGALVEVAAHTAPLLSGGGAGALALLVAWAVPDLRAARTRRYYDGDLLGALAFAVVLLAMPLARVEASWMAAGTGVLFGLLAGAAIDRLHPR